MNPRSLWEARDIVNGPNKLLILPRGLNCNPRDRGFADGRFVFAMPLNATGVISSPASGKFGEQVKGEAR
jgi:hypothetical protein